jgi:hypothetical protein
MLAEPKAMQVILASENKTAAGLGFDRNSLIPRIMALVSAFGAANGQVTDWFLH